MLLTSRRAAERLAAARQVLAQRAGDGPVIVLGGSAQAAPSLVRSLKRSTLGWERLTLPRLAALMAERQLLERRQSIASPLSLDAVWTRVVFELRRTSQLGRFSPIDDTPGLARALNRTIDELRRSGAQLDWVDADLRAAWQAWQTRMQTLRLADGATVLELSTAELRSRPVGAGPTVLALDVPLHHALEETFASALKSYATSMTVVCPRGDARSVEAWARVLGQTPTVIDVEGSTNLVRLQRTLFSDHQESLNAAARSPRTESREVASTSLDPNGLDRSPTPRCAGEAQEGPDLSVELLSAPGEARECVELVRRILTKAQQGVPFERMAVLLRSPQTYRAPLEEALRRAKVPAFFATGTRRPDVAGRAMLTLLACAQEGLSARRFAEYLSLSQVPDDDHGAPPAAWPESERFVELDDHDAGVVEEKTPIEASTEPKLDALEDFDAEGPVTAGDLRAPWRWERLIVDAAVIGGIERWKRRLRGLRESRLAERTLPNLTDAQRDRLARELSDLGALEAYALPLLELLSQLPTEATFRVWLEHLASLATRALKQPQRVLGVLQELFPLSEVGPASLAQVRATLTPRLLELTTIEQKSPMGQVYVAPVEAARGLEFDVVFVPALAERLFPQKVREDPLLPDAARAGLAAPLETNEGRVAAERLALTLALGAASKAVVLSWPRIEAEHARPRVPSFYVLEVLQAVHGHLPSFEAAQRSAETAGDARLGWPAPSTATAAIDDTEYDLAVLDGVLRGQETREGRAHYLMVQSPTLARALRSRYMRWSQSRWTKADGLVLSGPLEAMALHQHSLSQRAYAPTALEKFAACPYRFILSAVHRLQPMRMPEAIEAIGPMEKGSLVHEVQFRLLTAFRDEHLALTPEALPRLFARLDEMVDEVAHTFHDRYAPAIDRVWRDGVDTTKADLREWLRRMTEDPTWVPWRYELSFGLPLREQQDPASQSEPVTIDAQVTLRGSIDLVEKSVHGMARATDYKTGKVKALPGNVIGGGKQLQPALYALVLEKLLPDMAIDSSRLYYCTQVGGFQSIPTLLNQRTRDAVTDVVKALSSSFEKGFFPAVPDLGECRWCDYQPVCGPDEERRVTKKLANAHSRHELELLQKVRSTP